MGFNAKYPTVHGAQWKALNVILDAPSCICLIYLHMPRYDGQRAQIHKLADGSIHIFSRNGDQTTSRFPDLVHIIQDLCKPSAVSFIIDAEVVFCTRSYSFVGPCCCMFSSFIFLFSFSIFLFYPDFQVVGIDRKNGGKFLSFQELSRRERGSKASLVTLDRIKVIPITFMLVSAVVL